MKRWLARVGHERIQEIENPELAPERMKQLYEQKGYPKEWNGKRLREESGKLKVMAIRAMVPAIVLAPVADFVVKKIFHLKRHDIFLWRFYGSLAKACY